MNNKTKISTRIKYRWFIRLFVVIVVAVLYRIFLFEIMHVPSGSMENTIYTGDVILMSKFNYGTRVFTSDSVKRTLPTSEVKRNDVIIFNLPIGDTILSNFPDENYYKLLKKYKRKKILSKSFGEVIANPIQHREQYVKRCIGTPGDIIEIYANKVFINDTLIQENEHCIQQTGYGYIDTNVYRSLYARKNNRQYQSTFPNDHSHYWSSSFFGPLWIPQKGQSVDITPQNYSLYQRVISAYENNKIELRGNAIYINGKKNNNYTFTKDYYFVIGDNRDNSFDSRFWGFVPDDHIKGKAVMTLVSFGLTNKDVKRFFRRIK